MLYRALQIGADEGLLPPSDYIRYTNLLTRNLVPVKLTSCMRESETSWPTRW
jgi:hypothetical protein